MNQPVNRYLSRQAISFIASISCSNSCCCCWCGGVGLYSWKSRRVAVAIDIGDRLSPASPTELSNGTTSRLPKRQTAQGWRHDVCTARSPRKCWLCSTVSNLPSETVGLTTEYILFSIAKDLWKLEHRSSHLVVWPKIGAEDELRYCKPLQPSYGKLWLIDVKKSELARWRAQVSREGHNADVYILRLLWGIARDIGPWVMPENWQSSGKNMRNYLTGHYKKSNWQLPFSYSKLVYFWRF